MSVPISETPAVSESHAVYELSPDVIGTMCTLRVVLAMADARGYRYMDGCAMDEKDSELHPLWLDRYMDAHDFVQKHMEAIARVYSRRILLFTNAEGSTFAVLVCVAEKLRVGDVRWFLRELTNVAGLTECVTLVPQKETPTGKAELIAGLRHLKHHRFHYWELQQHTTSEPKIMEAIVRSTYRVVLDPEAARVRKILRAADDKLPPLLPDDLVARYYGWNPGTLVEVTRYLGGNTEPSKYWKIVAGGSATTESDDTASE